VPVDDQSRQEDQGHIAERIKDPIVGAIGEPFAGCAVVAGTAYLAIHGPQVPRFAVLIGCGGSLMFTLSTSSVAGFVT